MVLTATTGCNTTRDSTGSQPRTDDYLYIALEKTANNLRVSIFVHDAPLGEGWGPPAGPEFDRKAPPGEFHCPPAGPDFDRKALAEEARGSRF